MGIGGNNFNSNSIEYETPEYIFSPLKVEFDIKIDVAASLQNCKCEYFITKEENALEVEWEQNFWLNPPWSRDLKKWVAKAYQQVNKNNIIGVLLLPVRTNTHWWHKYIIDPKQEVRFLKGETKFVGMKRGLWLPVAIIIMRATNSNLECKPENCWRIRKDKT